MTSGGGGLVGPDTVGPVPGTDLWPAVIVTDAAGTVIHWNAAAERLYGWRADEVLGRSILDINIDEPDADTAAQIMAHLGAGKPWEGRFRVRHRNGTTFMAWVADAPLTGTDGHTVGVVGLSVPVTVSAAEAAAGFTGQHPLSGAVGNGSPALTGEAPAPARPRVAVVGIDEVTTAGVGTLLRRHLDRLDLASGDPATTADRPDVVLAAVGAVRPSTVPVVSRLLDLPTPPPVVVVSAREDDETVLESVRRGVSGYLLTKATSEDLVTAIELVARGELVIDPRVAAAITRRVARAEDPDVRVGDRWGLQPREQEVLELLTAGHSNREIAERLYLSPETVKSHLRSVYRKLGVKDRTGAVAAALGRGRRH